MGATAHVWRSEKNFRELILSFHHNFQDSNSGHELKQQYLERILDYRAKNKKIGQNKQFPEASFRDCPSVLSAS